MVLRRLRKRIYHKCFWPVILFILIGGQETAGQLNIQHYIELGKRSLFRNDNSEAIRRFNTVIKINPELFQPYFFRGVAKFNLGDYMGARSDFSTVISLHPYFTHAYHYRGITQERLNNYFSALKDYNSALDIDPVNPDIYSSRGFTRMLMNDTTGALDDFNEAIMLDPYHYQAYLNRSSVWSMKKDFNKALDDCSKAISINKHEIEAFYRRGLIWYNKGDFDNALEDFNFLIRIDSTNSRAFYFRALTKYKQNNLQGAMDDYNKVIKLDPLNALTYYNRAVLKAQVGENQEAISDYDKVVELNPNNIFAYYNRAGVKLNIGDIYGAIRDFTKVLDLYPGFTQAYLNRAMAKNMINDLIGAMEDQEMANRISSDSVFQNDIATIDSTYFNKIIELKANFDNGNITSKDFYSLETSVKMKPVFLVSFTVKNAENRSYYQDIRELNKSSSGPFFLDLILVDEPKTVTYQNDNELKKNFHYKEDSFQGLFLQGLIYGYNHDFNNAFEFMDKALKKDPDNYLIYFNIGGLKYQLVEVLNSIDLKDDFLMIEDRKVETHKTLNSDRTNYEEIIRIYDRTLVLNPNFAPAYFNRGYIKSLINDLPGAFSDYRQAISLNPDMAEAYFNRGLIQIYLEETDQGCKDISKAGELGLPEAYYVIRKYCR